jgi:hypothetical protein
LISCRPPFVAVEYRPREIAPRSDVCHGARLIAAKSGAPIRIMRL